MPSLCMFVKISFYIPCVALFACSHASEKGNVSLRHIKSERHCAVVDAETETTDTDISDS